MRSSLSRSSTGRHAQNEVIKMILTSTTNRPLIWLRRYLPAQLICTATGLLCTWTTATFTGSAAAAIAACIWGEILSFYGTMIARDRERRVQHEK
jgi:hypothetical protein